MALGLSWTEHSVGMAFSRLNDILRACLACVKETCCRYRFRADILLLVTEASLDRSSPRDNSRALEPFTEYSVPLELKAPRMPR